MADGTYQKDGDAGFIGLNSRDNPSALPQGYVSESRNYRLDRGVASARKGLERRTKGLLAGNDIYGSCTYIDSTGQEIIVVVTTNKLWTYNPQTDFLDTAKTFPAGETITTSDGCDVIQAMDNIFITRGYNKRPLLWDMISSVLTVFPPVTSGSAGNQFPNPNVLAYYGNRLIAQARHHNDTVDARHRDSVSVSNYLDYNHWDILDVFTFNNGGNDQVVAIAPWTLNEFVVFMRHSVFYVNIGVGRYTTGDSLSNDSFIKTLVNDIGCIANRSIVQAGGGILFLSDNGVYFMNPTQVGSNESMRLLTSESPLSAPIDDVIQRINRNYAYRSVGCYWGNRYYLAVPLDGSDKNNAVLVYNFILKAWESVDTYPAGIDIFNFVVAKYNNQRRLFLIDTDQGIFLTEELDHDEYGNATGTPIIPAYLPFTLGATEYESNLIDSSLTTRRYTMGSFSDKRFSGTEIDFLFQAGSAIETEALVANEDTSILIDSYGSGSDNDETRRTPIRKFGTGIQLRFSTKNIRPSIRSAFVYGTIKSKNIISKK
jgi:hypothetical protein